MRKFEILDGPCEWMKCDENGEWSSKNPMTHYEGHNRVSKATSQIKICGRVCDNLTCRALADNGEGVFTFEFCRGKTPLKAVKVFFRTHPKFTLPKITVEEIDLILSACSFELSMENEMADVYAFLHGALAGFQDSLVTDELLRLHDDTELELPKLDNVCWHVSAGMDWKPLVFFSNARMGIWDQKAEFSRPSLHVFTCLSGDQELDILNLLESSEPVFEDGLSRIYFDKYTYVSVNDKSLVENSKGYCDFNRGLIFDEFKADGFLVNVRLEDVRTGYTEVTQLLYLFTENIATFQRFVSMGDTKVKHLVATCEGLAFGGCRHSIFKYLMGHNVLNDLVANDSVPETVTLPNRGHSERFIRRVKHDPHLDFERVAGYFLGPHSVCKLRSNKRKIKHLVA